MRAWRLCGRLRLSTRQWSSAGLHAKPQPRLLRPQLLQGSVWVLLGGRSTPGNVLARSQVLVASLAKILSKRMKNKSCLELEAVSLKQVVRVANPRKTIPRLRTCLWTPILLLQAIQFPTHPKLAIFFAGCRHLLPPTDLPLSFHLFPLLPSDPLSISLPEPNPRASRRSDLLLSSISSRLYHHRPLRLYKTLSRYLHAHEQRAGNLSCLRLHFVALYPGRSRSLIARYPYLLHLLKHSSCSRHHRPSPLHALHRP